VAAPHRNAAAPWPYRAAALSYRDHTVPQRCRTATEPHRNAAVPRPYRAAALPYVIAYESHTRRVRYKRHRFLAGPFLF